MVEGGMKCVKYILFAFNLIFFLVGLALIIAGAVVQARMSDYFDFFGGSVSAAAILLIVVGVIVFVIGFFGCCGAYRENYCMTMTFAVLLAIVFILEIAAGIAAYVMRDQVQDQTNKKMKEAMQNYNQTGHSGVDDAWDALQRDFKCCGVEKPDDWLETKYGKYPPSCCKIENQECIDKKERTPSDIRKDGCEEGFVKWVKKNIYVIGGVGIGLAFIQIFGIIAACCLAQSIRRDYEVV